MICGGRNKSIDVVDEASEEEVARFQKQTSEVVKRHEAYLRRYPDGKLADLRQMDLRNIQWPSVDLRQALLANANLSNAMLAGANFNEA